MSEPARKPVREVNHPLIDRLIEEFGYTEVTSDNHDGFVNEPGMNVLFFPGDPSTVKDATDVAVVLPELVAAFDGKIRPGIIKDVYGDGLELKRHYGFKQYPALVFMRSGEYVGVLTRIRDWSEYLEEIPKFFTVESRRPPGFSIPVVTESS